MIGSSSSVTCTNCGAGVDCSATGTTAAYDPWQHDHDATCSGLPCSCWTPTTTYGSLPEPISEAEVRYDWRLRAEACRAGALRLKWHRPRARDADIRRPRQWRRPVKWNRLRRSVGRKTA